MSHDPGLVIEQIEPGSVAAQAGLAPDDAIVSINSNRIRDVIDFMFHKKEPDLTMVIRRKNKKLTFRLTLQEDGSEGNNLGIEIRPFKITTCTNKCLFCFVMQLPRGLRRTLYIKDEDYRMSFLYGNYITLTNLSLQDKKRIVEQRLSPLYLSIHSTNKGIRNILLGNPKAPDVMKELAFFKDHKIRMHCQIVLCPGYNDGTALRETIRDLYRFYPYVASIAVVPVGLTAHRKTGPQLRPVEKDDAVRAIETIETFQKRFTKRHGDSLVYGSDELYIRAAASFPSLSTYGELPQMENGVGMVPLFLHQARRLRIPPVKQGRRFLTFSGVSFYPFLVTFIERLRKAGIDVEALPIENSFFGTSVTVTGLLTGRDVVKRLAGIVREDDTLLIPDVVMREGEAVFLDDVSKQDIEGILGIPTHVIASTPRGLLDGILSSS